MNWHTTLPLLNATLNGISAVLIVSGRILIRRGKREAHRALMIAAVCTSAAFLTSYVTYHAFFPPTHFGGQGWSRPVYFSILISHTILAMVIVPMVLITLARGVKGSFERHRAIARWTFPVWLYVSVTGVVIYLMLYRIFPA